MEIKREKLKEIVVRFIRVFEWFDPMLYKEKKAR